MIDEKYLHFSKEAEAENKKYLRSLMKYMEPLAPAGLLDTIAENWYKDMSKDGVEKYLKENAKANLKAWATEQYPKWIAAKFDAIPQAIADAIKAQNDAN